MACKEWNDDWIAELYGELETTEARRLTRHIEGCAECRTTLDHLAASRELLSGAAPQVPVAPRVVCVEPRRSRLSPAWAFAAGVACATIAFAIGMTAAPEAKPAMVERPIMDARLEPMEQLERRVSELEQLNAAMLAESGDESPEENIESRLASLERRISVDRAHDLDYLLSEINASERRAGNWIGETREALRLVALQSDPRVSHQ